jgi:hypothetical protein
MREKCGYLLLSDLRWVASAMNPTACPKMTRLMLRSAAYHIDRNNKPCLNISYSLYFVSEDKILENGEWSKPGRGVSLGATNRDSAGNR